MSQSWKRQADFNNFLIERNVIGFFESPVVLKSGRQSNWYVNFRTIAEDAMRLDILSDFVVDFVGHALAAKLLPASPLALYGVPEGATKAAIIAQMKWAKASPEYREGSHPVPMGRAKPKEHGMAKDKFFVGEPRGATIVLEDVTTTGGSLLTTLDSLRAADVQVVGALGFAHRMERRDDGLTVKEAIARKNPAAPYLFMSSALELLPLAAARLSPAKGILKAIEHEFEQWGEGAISF